MRLTRLTSRHSQGCILSEVSRVNFIFLLFSMFRDLRHSLALSPFLHLQNTSVQTLRRCHSTFFLTWPSFLSLKRPVWLHWAHLDNLGKYSGVKILNLTYLQSSSCHVRTHSHRFLGLGCGHLLRAILLSTLQPYSGIPLSNKKRTRCWYGQELGGVSRTLCCVKQASLKRSCIYGLISMTFSKRQICIDAEQISGRQGLRVGRMWLQRESIKEFAEMMGLFHILIAVVVIWIDTWVESHRILFQKKFEVNFTLYF